MSKSLHKRLSNIQQWQPPAHWLRIQTIDAHTEGEPLRVIVSGFPELACKSILEQRQQARLTFDHLRTALMWEPRGHADMYGCLIIPPITPEADFGVLFMHNEGYSTMCGHGIIAVTKVALDCGLIPITPPLTRVIIDSPAGQISAFAKIVDNTVDSIYFHNVPSFVAELDAKVEVPGIGEISYDLGFGGAFYAVVKADPLGLRCVPEAYRNLIDVGMRIKRAIMASREIVHPFEEDLGFLYGTIFIGEAQSQEAHSRNVCIFAEGEVDRSPTGTGVSARMAIHHARGEIGLHQPQIIESIIGSRFTASITETRRFGPYPAVIPEVEGRAYITGKQDFIFDPGDPLRNGFILR